MRGHSDAHLGTSACVSLERGACIVPTVLGLVGIIGRVFRQGWNDFRSGADHIT